MKKIISLVLALSLVITACLAITPKAAELVGDKSNWKVSTTSEVSWGIIEKAFDGDTKTYWHSNYKAQGSTILSHDEAPFEITIILPSATAVSGFIYTPRLDSNTGRMQEFEIYISADDTTAPALIMK
ncbi:MAG: discoidin domain-containing protein, partial [Bacillota bacterium]|nr:discoidin domain-containing protein [Bacillota bacterium]